MSSSQIQIANAALIKVGGGTIVSLADDHKGARAISARWDALRDDEQRIRRWSFAIKRTSLAALSTAPDHGFALWYALPAGFLRLDMVADRYPAQPTGDYIGDEATEWVIEGGRILTDFAAPLKLRYGARITDTTLWDAAFDEVMACRIALDISDHMRASASAKVEARKDYLLAVKMAIRANAIERPPVAMPDNSWMMSRL